MEQKTALQAEVAKLTHQHAKDIAAQVKQHEADKEQMAKLSEEIRTVEAKLNLEREEADRLKKELQVTQDELTNVMVAKIPKETNAVAIQTDEVVQPHSSPSVPTIVDQPSSSKPTSPAPSSRSSSSRPRRSLARDLADQAKCVNNSVQDESEVIVIPSTPPADMEDQPKQTKEKQEEQSPFELKISSSSSNRLSPPIQSEQPRSSPSSSPSSSSIPSPSVGSDSVASGSGSGRKSLRARPKSKQQIEEEKRLEDARIQAEEEKSLAMALAESLKSAPPTAVDEKLPAEMTDSSMIDVPTPAKKTSRKKKSHDKKADEKSSASESEQESHTKDMMDTTPTFPPVDDAEKTTEAELTATEKSSKSKGRKRKSNHHETESENGEHEHEHKKQKDDNGGAANSVAEEKPSSSPPPASPKVKARSAKLPLSGTAKPVEQSTSNASTASSHASASTENSATTVVKKQRTSPRIESALLQSDAPRSKIKSVQP